MSADTNADCASGGGGSPQARPKRARKRPPVPARHVPQSAAPVHPEFSVDLDAPAHTRWAEVMRELKDELEAIVPAVEESLVGAWLAAQDTRGSRAAHLGIAAATYMATRALPCVTAARWSVWRDR